MKKIKLVIIALSILLNSRQFFAQENNYKSDKCVGKGSFIIDTYYGYPFLFGQYTKTDNATKVINLNHLGAKCEFMINKIVGLGLEYTYAMRSETYTDNLNGSGTSIGMGTFQSTITKQRLLAKANFHFATTSVLDPYVSAGLGYKFFHWTDSNPNSETHTSFGRISIDDFNSFANSFPISYRYGIGLRYYFISNLGICAEAGIGGPLIQAGVTGKF